MSKKRNKSASDSDRCENGIFHPESIQSENHGVLAALTEEQRLEIERACIAAHGKALWEETQIIPMEKRHVEGAMGIEGCYESSLIPSSLITALAVGAFPETQEAYRKNTRRRGGMLNMFRQKPVYRHDPHKETFSVCETMLSELDRTAQQSTENSQGAIAPSGERMPTIYEGRVLVHEKYPHVVLAWLDYYRSRIHDVQQRTEKRDEYVFQLNREYEGLTLDDGLDLNHYVSMSPQTLNFYTLNGRVPGAASVLFKEAVSEWSDWDYSSILLWRHKILRVVTLAKDQENNRWGIRHNYPFPQGNNDESEESFKAKGFREFATKLSDQLAVRHMYFPMGKDVLVSSTQAYMIGETKRVMQKCKELNTAQYRKCAS